MGLVVVVVVVVKVGGGPEEGEGVGGGGLLDCQADGWRCRGPIGICTLLGGGYQARDPCSVGS